MLKYNHYAGMVELVDSVDLGSTAKSVQVRVLLPAPKQYYPNQIFPVGDGFGFFVFFGRFEETYFQNGVAKLLEFHCGFRQLFSVPEM